jgi:hypothetical protein
MLKDIVTQHCDVRAPTFHHSDFTPWLFVLALGIATKTKEDEHEQRFCDHPKSYFRKPHRTTLLIYPLQGGKEARICRFDKERIRGRPLAEVELRQERDRTNLRFFSMKCPQIKLI